MELDIIYSSYLHQIPITTRNKVNWGIRTLSNFIAAHIRQGYEITSQVSPPYTQVALKKWSPDGSELYASVALIQRQNFESEDNNDC